MVPRYTRRSVLRLGGLGLLSAVAGCMASSDSEQSRQPSPTATKTPGTSRPPTSSSRTLSMGETATSTDGVSVTISAPKVRKIIFTPDVGSIAHSYPAGTSDSQFLGVAVSTQATDITSLQLAPVIDGSAYKTEPYRHTFNPGKSGRLSFQLPVVQAQRGAVVWRPSADEQYRWTLPDSVLTMIGSAPRFKVTQFAVPDSITRGNPFRATLTVRNAGNRDGRFLAVVLTEGPSSVPLIGEFTSAVPVGETITRDLSGRGVDVERSSMTAILDWGINEQQASFSITK